MNWEPKTSWHKMYRQNQVENEDGITEMMVEVGTYESSNGIKSYNSDVEYQDTKNEELYYVNEEGDYVAVE